MILHVDANCFYASCEMRDHPELRYVPMVVGGDASQRHGIVVAKNDLAKATGIKTAEVLWQARKKCPNLVCMPPRMALYAQISESLHAMLGEYTDLVEPFGLDEAWMDLTDAPWRDGPAVADALRRRAWEELGITISVGVSFSKIFAKLGSDMQKPDATTVISRENYRRTVWPLGVREMLYVGAASARHLAQLGILTIGDLARAPRATLQSVLGKHGLILHDFANGLDGEMVAPFGHMGDSKSVGNSTTSHRDLACDEDIKLTFHLLAESVAARLREQGLLARTVQIWVRDTKLATFERQCRLHLPTQLSGELALAAMALFAQHYHWDHALPLRSLGLCACDVEVADGAAQLSLLEADAERQRMVSLERTLDGIRGRYGYFSVQRGMMLSDPQLAHLDAKKEHVPARLTYQGKR